MREPCSTTRDRNDSYLIRSWQIEVNHSTQVASSLRMVEVILRMIRRVVEYVLSSCADLRQYDRQVQRRGLEN